MTIVPGMYVVRTDDSTAKVVRVRDVTQRPTTSIDGASQISRYISVTVMVNGELWNQEPLVPLEVVREATKDEIAAADEAGDLPK